MVEAVKGLKNIFLFVTSSYETGLRGVYNVMVVFLLLLNIGWGQSGKLIITGVLDGPLTGGKPKMIELFVREDVSDLDDYGVERCANGASCGSAPDYTSMDGSASAGSYVYLSYESSSDGSFSTFFGFNADYYSCGAANINGDDVIELQYTSDNGVSWTAIDIFGAEGTDGSGQDWEYLDSWAKSNTLRSTATTFSTSNWTFGSKNALDGESTNAAASTPFPLGGAPIKGDGGFRLLSVPVAGTTYDDLLSPLWIQGITNGDVSNGTANVWTYDATNTEWDALSNLTGDTYTAGTGLVAYIYSDIDYDNDDDISSTKAIELYVTGQEGQATVSVTTVASEWNLLGNPFRLTIDADNLSLGGSDGTNDNYEGTVYVWDDAASGGAAYISWNGSTGDLSNGLIAPYQGFWSQSKASGTSFSFTSSATTSSSGSFYKTTQTYSATFTVTSETSSQNFYFSFNQDGNVGMDSHDAHKLMPLDITPRLVGMSFADGNSLGTNNLPLNLTGSTEIDVDVMSLDVTDGVFETAGEDVTLSWDLSAAPAGLSFMLTNTQTQETADLSLTDAYTFTTQEKGSVVSDGSGVSSYPLVGTPLLKLTISALSQNVDENPMPSAFALHPAYPNPFNPSTTITFDVPDYIAQPTLLQIYDISGSLVQTLVNGVVDPGTHSVSWGPKNLSSGIYIVELRAGDNTFNHKISYIK